MNIIKFIFKDYFHTLKVKKLESQLADEILKLSSFYSIDIKQIIYKLQKSNNDIVSKEFAIINKKINKGHKIKDLFEVLKKKYHSDLLDQFLDLIYISTTTGTVSLKDYKNLSAKFLKSKEIINERKSLLLMQKYTILFAGALIVPAILGVIISLVLSLSSSVDISMIGISNNVSLFSVSYYSSIIYIIEYVIISSIYLSLLEDNSKKSIVYLSFLLPASLLIFFVSKILI
jgi:hypothetical protein